MANDDGDTVPDVTDPVLRDAVSGFLSELDTAIIRGDRIVYRDLLDSWGLTFMPGDLVGFWPKLLVWSEHRGWTLTPLGFEYVDLFRSTI